MKHAFVLETKENPLLLKVSKIKFYTQCVYKETPLDNTIQVII